jgi:hypothetical protein
MNALGLSLLMIAVCDDQSAILSIVVRLITPFMAVADAGDLRCDDRDLYDCLFRTLKDHLADL